VKKSSRLKKRRVRDSKIDRKELEGDEGVIVGGGRRVRVEGGGEAANRRS